MITPIPYRLTCDDDGHSYLMPETKLALFEDMLKIVDHTTPEPGRGLVAAVVAGVAAGVAAERQGRKRPPSRPRFRRRLAALLRRLG